MQPWVGIANLFVLVVVVALLVVQPYMGRNCGHTWVGHIAVVVALLVLVVVVALLALAGQYAKVIAV